MQTNGNLQKHQNPNGLHRALLEQFHANIRALAVDINPATALDVGCGEAFTLTRLFLNLDAQLFGTDFSAPALAWGFDKSWKKTVWRPSQSDIHRLPYPDSSVDLVLCLEVLEHLPDSSAGLAEVLRVAKRHVIISVPHEPWFRGGNLLRGKNITRLGNDPEHLQNFGRNGFERLVMRACGPHGATLQKIVYSFPWQIALIRKEQA